VESGRAAAGADFMICLSRQDVHAQWSQTQGFSPNLNQLTCLEVSSNPEDFD